MFEDLPYQPQYDGIFNVARDEADVIDQEHGGHDMADELRIFYLHTKVEVLPIRDRTLVTPSRKILFARDFENLKMNLVSKTNSERKN